MARLLSVLDVVGKGAPRVVHLVGDPGSGKSRLLSWFAEQARRSGAGVVSWRCDGRDQGVPLGSVADLLDLGQLTATSGDGTSAGAAGGIRAVGRQVRALLEERASQGLVLLLDDVHWADPESVELIEFLVRKPVRAPLLLVLAHRGRQAPAKLAAALADGCVDGVVERIDLGPIGPVDAARLLGMAVGDPAVARLTEEAEGNPLYLRVLADGGPSDEVSATLTAEMALLSPAEAVVADVGAVFGRFGLNGIAYATGLPADVVCHAVGDLHRRNLIRTVARSPSYAFEFRHRVVADIRYEGIEPCARRKGHLKAFQYHVDQGEDGLAVDRHVELALAVPDEETVQAVRETAERLVRTNPAAVARWLGIAARALVAAGGQPAELVAVTDLRARALAAAGRHQQSREVLDALVEDPVLRSGPERLRLVAAAALRDAFLGQPVDAASGGDLPVRLVVAQAFSAMVENLAPNPELVALALDTARRSHDTAGEAGALAVRAMGQIYGGEVDAASETVVACARLVDGLADDALDGDPEYLAILGWAEALLCWMHPAERHLRRGMALARRTGRVHALPLLLVGLSGVRRQTGRTDEARVLAAEAVDHARRMEAGEVLGLALAAEALCAAPDQHALWLAERAAAELSPRHGWSWAASVALGFAAGAEGDGERFRRLVVEAGGGPELPVLPVFLRAPCFEALATVAIGRGEDVRPWVERAALAAEAFPGPVQRGAGELAWGHLLRASGEGHAAVACYLKAAETFAPAGLVPSQVRAILLAATAAVEAGSFRLAGMLVGRGRALAAQFGVSRGLGVSRGFGVARGEEDEGVREVPRPRESPCGALGTLTNREQEVARIAGEGATTREIAKRLSLSPRTVDVHLTKIYRKLHLRSRAELARFMAAVN
nr:LuxR family transcriptional regulator [Umezawaea tangerina]